ncbi:ABC transporter substrate-binding protein [Mycolicibacterium sp.]|uniref:ABC transporter substrate-binding protein n=1 Tax=Mycolicibacterium sp. TaxID=2320850 RepID=UPI001A2618F9|nr:ABC transporter substrate-binding protein [Mycolicibacterium sp.]MBJ7339568.1 ABC transporter substrate-binding protein [Mycolicibacterium sp.]
MPSIWSRRSFLAMTAGLACATVACSSDKPGTVAGDGSVTVKHAFGETKIPSAPKRVVSAGFTEQDDLLALGVVPIAITDWFGGEPFAVWPWAQPKLGTAQPVVLNLYDGIEVDQIAALKPDLIVATNAGLDQDTYTKLAAIAPTIAQSGQSAFFEPWKDQASAIGQAVFKFDEMTKLVADVDAKFAEIGKNNPSFTGKKIVITSATTYQDQYDVTPPGWRTEFLTQMGFAIPDSVTAVVKDDRAQVPRAKLASVLDAADVVVWTTQSDDEQAALIADPTFAALKSTRTNRNVFTGKELAGALAFTSVLSYPVVADRLPQMISKVLT